MRHCTARLRASRRRRRAYEGPRVVGGGLRRACSERYYERRLFRRGPARARVCPALGSEFRVQFDSGWITLVRYRATSSWGVGIEARFATETPRRPVGGSVVSGVFRMPDAPPRARGSASDRGARTRAGRDGAAPRGRGPGGGRGLRRRRLGSVGDADARRCRFTTGPISAGWCYSRGIAIPECSTTEDRQICLSSPNTSPMRGCIELPMRNPHARVLLQPGQWWPGGLRPRRSPPRDR